MRTLLLSCIALVVASASSAQEAKTSRLVLPAVGSAPETGLQLGVVVMKVDRPATARRPTVNQAYVLVTAKHQYQFSVEHDAWSAGDAWRRYLKVDLMDFPLPYFGVGADAPDAAEEWFTARTVQALAKVQRRISGAWYGMAVARALHTDIRDAEPGSVVAGGALRGFDGGTLVQPGVGVSYDTRDDVIGTETGRFLEATIAVATTALGSDFTTQRTLVDGRLYRRVGPGVVATQAYVELHAGSPPFDQMSLVGNKNVLRGYTKGRYRDRALAAAQVEWRAPIRGRWRYAIFGGVGTIGDSPSDLGAVTLPTYGVGIRFCPFKTERSSLRLDVARGRSGSSGLYIAIDEAF
ncbi:MAG: BamA/TamA family outer membrane protein [Gemmatimonadaceae bacterium]